MCEYRPTLETSIRIMSLYSQYSVGSLALSPLSLSVCLNVSPSTSLFYTSLGLSLYYLNVIVVNPDKCLVVLPESDNRL